MTLPDLVAPRPCPQGDVPELRDLPAPAKLNLFLHITGRRDDGYHLLQSVFVPVDWADRLHLIRQDDGTLSRLDLGEQLPQEDLCLRAARLLQQASGTRFGVRIEIDKQIPSGAGMGGGSSDAATVLIGLNRLWGLDWPRARLMPLAVQLGADVPFFLGEGPAFVEGIGEQLTQIPYEAQRFHVVKPAASLPTAKIFADPLLPRSTNPIKVAVFLDSQREQAASPAAMPQASSLKLASQEGFASQDGSPSDSTGSKNESKAASEKNACTDRKKMRIISVFGSNDMEQTAKRECFEVGQALEMLAAVHGNSRMTGSGSAVFSWVSDESQVAANAVATGTGANAKANCADQELLDLPQGWKQKMCWSLSRHPLASWLS